MEECAKKTRKVLMAAQKCVAIAATKRSRPRSRNAATANSTGVATSSAKLASKMSNLPSVNKNLYYCHRKSSILFPSFSLIIQCVSLSATKQKVPII